MFEDVSLVEPDPQARPYDEGDNVGEEEGEISLVSTSLLPSWIVLAGLPAVTETTGGDIFGLQSPVWWRRQGDPGAPVPEKVLQRNFPLTH